jgi:hypothetical protein
MEESTKMCYKIYATVIAASWKLHSYVSSAHVQVHSLFFVMT